jgi:hypothetical protein
MNERYKTLWYQAAETTTDSSWEQQTKFMERYTKLVIQESIDVIVSHDYHGQWLGEKIKQHFGVDQ